MNAEVERFRCVQIPFVYKHVTYKFAEVNWTKTVQGVSRLCVVIVQTHNMIILKSSSLKVFMMYYSMSKALQKY